MNTVCAITASAVSAVAVCRLKTGRLNMEVVMHSVLAGGVSIGSCTCLIVTPPVAMAIGCFSGIISAVLFFYFTPFLEKYMGIHDTCGVLNLHGIPGLIGGIAGAVSAYLSESAYRSPISNVVD